MSGILKWALALSWLAHGLACVWGAPAVVQLGDARAWERVEFRVSEVPSCTNNFDPDLIRLDATFATPSGRTLVAPGFWFQDYERSLVNGSEKLTAVGSPEWRLRFRPSEPGTHTLSLAIQTNGVAAANPAVLHFNVAPNPDPARTGFVRIGGSGRYFATGDGQPLPLIGECVCWDQGRGTRDYEDWFNAMSQAGENYARLWMAPWAFGIEYDKASARHYRLDRAWQLDDVLRRAERQGIYLMLCIDYHGMFEIEPDYWGGNNYWPVHPYNVTQGGPCVKPNDFFTNSTARQWYRNRLRYLIARYGDNTHLLAWEFFNEIDNVYAHLTPADVAAWHAAMADWLRAQDPYGHLITTSLTGGSVRAELWSLPQLDFTQYHSYGDASPATRLAEVAASLFTQFKKPVMIGEFGTDWRGWNREGDPFLRGFRQGLWGGALGGSVGSSMAWYWEKIHDGNLYPLYRAMGTILTNTAWGGNVRQPIGFQTAAAPPTTVGALTPGGTPFDATLIPGATWGTKPVGQMAIPIPEAAGLAATSFNSFVHGTSHADLRTPFKMNAWFGEQARLVMHLNSVSDGAVLSVRVDGTEVLHRSLPNKDGTYAVNNEYNEDIPVTLAAGRHLIEIRNAGGDWFYLDWVRLERVLPAAFAQDWSPTPAAIGLWGSRTALLYVVAPWASFPSQATNATLPLREGLSVTLTNWPQGVFIARWHDPATGSPLTNTVAATTPGGLLQLPLPAFREDLAGVVVTQPELSASLSLEAGWASLQLMTEPQARCMIEQATNVTGWHDFQGVTNTSGTLTLPLPINAPAQYYRARRMD